MNNADLPAYPQPIAENNGTLHSTWDFSKDDSGLTKREEIAAMAMQGLLANYRAQQDMQNEAGYTGDNFADVLAQNSVGFADALLKALDKINT